MELILMKGARYHLEAGAMVVEDLPVPEAGPGEVLLKVRYCGVCGSDLTRYRQLSNPPERLQKLGIISPVQGHEFCGVVERLGEGTPEAWNDGSPVKGSPALVHPQLGCGKCSACRSRFWGGCSHPEKTALIGVQLNGGLAEYAAVPFDHLIPISKRGDEDLMKAALAEPLAIALHMVNKSELTIDDTLVIIGDGIIGILLFRLLASLGYEKTTLIGRHEKKMAIARCPGGGRIVMESEITEEFHGKARCVFQAAGSQAAFDLGFDLLGHGARMIVIGYLYEGKGLETTALNALIRNEKRLYGSYTYTYDEMREALRLIEGNKIDVLPLIGKVVPLENCVKDGFDPLISPDPIPGKVLIRMEGLSP